MYALKAGLLYTVYVIRLQNATTVGIRGYHVEVYISGIRRR